LIGAPPETHAETAGYLQRGTIQIAYVLHPAQRRRLGQVLLVGAFGTGRSTAYVPWVRWARCLTEAGIEVLRFDHSGTGESTGEMAHVSCEDWLDDVLCCARWLRERGQGCRLALHGLEFGALLAGRAFRDGMGDALLAWSAPPTARDVLGYALRLRAASDYMHRMVRSRADYIAEMEAGRPLNVAGYLWSPELWRTAGDLTWVDPPGPNGSGSPWRPWHVQQLDASAGSLFQPWDGTAPPHRNTVELLPDLRGLFAENLQWIRGALSNKEVACATCSR
jgi:hypothetical protein